MALITVYHKFRDNTPHYIGNVRSWQAIIRILQDREYRRVQVIKHPTVVNQKDVTLTLIGEFAAQVILWL